MSVPGEYRSRLIEVNNKLLSMMNTVYIAMEKAEPRKQKYPNLASANRALELLSEAEHYIKQL